jgi:XTP/dITP diphosphohydrolase
MKNQYAQTIVYASSNTQKLREVQALVVEFELIAQSAFSVEQPEESGLSFIENALQKARVASAASGLPAIGDDSGLQVAALHGAPGLFSARYAGPQGSDRDNVDKLLQNMADRGEESRAARYVCAMAYVSHAEDACPLIALSVWHGSINHAPQGDEGYGYDSVFYLPEQGCTVAQLSFEQRQVLSNRTRALMDLVTQIEQREWR